MWILAASSTPCAAEGGCRAERLLLSRVQVGVFGPVAWVDLLRMSDFGPIRMDPLDPSLDDTPLTFLIKNYRDLSPRPERAYKFQNSIFAFVCKGVQMEDN